MHRSQTRWTTAAAAAALIALPVAGAAQTTGTTPAQQPPAQTHPQQQPPAQTQPQQQPTAQQPPTASEPAAQAGTVDANAAKKHLSDARDTLSQITTMPEAAKLQGDNRTQVSQLISNFNELITTPTDWRASYSKVDANLTALLGADDQAGTAAVGTSGATGAASAAGTSGTTASLDPAIRAKLVDFRKQLKDFQEAAGGSHAQSGAMAPSADPSSTSNPANPASSAGGERRSVQARSAAHVGRRDWHQRRDAVPDGQHEPRRPGEGG